MYKLYASIGHWTEIDRSNEEKDIIDTIGDYLHDDEELRFMVIQRENNTDNCVRNIENMQDYVNYLSDYKARQETCVELKKYIVGKQKVLKK